MKKTLLGLIFIVLLLGTTVQAKTGDVTGSIYSTDIQAIINCIEVPSYNIGGRTVIIVEDITKEYYYNDELRTLIIGGFTPDEMVGGRNEYSGIPVGRKIGNLYETDIKTYIRGVQLPCYSLNGKMAVAIEDLGVDNGFGVTGGKYIWKPNDKTIELEFIYMFNNSIDKIMSEKHVNMLIDDNYSATFISEPIMHGSISGLKTPENGLPQPILADGETIGYAYKPKDCFRFYVDENNKTHLTTDDGDLYFYFYDEKVEKVLKNIEIVKPTRDDWLAYYETQMMRVIDSLETDEYTFLYMSQPNSHGSSQFLRLVLKDGTEICYENEFESVSLHGQKYFDNVVIDKKNEKVTFRYDKNYEIDLQTGILTQKD